MLNNLLNKLYNTFVYKTDFIEIRFESTIRRVLILFFLIPVLFILIMPSFAQKLKPTSEMIAGVVIFFFLFGYLNLSRDKLRIYFKTNKIRYYIFFSFDEDCITNISKIKLNKGNRIELHFHSGKRFKIFYMDKKDELNEFIKRFTNVIENNCETECKLIIQSDKEYILKYETIAKI